MEKSASKYDEIKDLKPDKFRRLTGIKPTVFALMIEVLKRAEKRKRKLGGKTSKLCLEDRLLLCLEYLREYRTYFHVATSYGISESNCFRIIRRIENILVKSRIFALPKRTVALSDFSIVATTIDCTESPVERPQKNSADTTRERRNGTRSKRR